MLHPSFSRWKITNQMQSLKRKEHTLRSNSIDWWYIYNIYICRMNTDQQEKTSQLVFNVKFKSMSQQIWLAFLYFCYCISGLNLVLRSLNVWPVRLDLVWTSIGTWYLFCGIFVTGSAYFTCIDSCEKSSFDGWHWPCSSHQHARTS